MIRKLDPKNDYDQKVIQATIPLLDSPSYQEIKTILEHIIKDSIDIDSYKPTAIHLADLMKALVTGHYGTIFFYPIKNIDPGIFGCAEKLRRECKDLLDRLKLIEDIKQGKTLEVEDIPVAKGSVKKQKKTE